MIILAGALTTYGAETYPSHSSKAGRTAATGVARTHTGAREKERERDRRETEKRTRAEDANGGDDGGDGSGVVE